MIDGTNGRRKRFNEARVYITSVPRKQFIAGFGRKNAVISWTLTILS
jgi:hypothetical protein